MLAICEPVVGKRDVGAPDRPIDPRERLDVPESAGAARFGPSATPARQGCRRNCPASGAGADFPLTQTKLRRRLSSRGCKGFFTCRADLQAEGERRQEG